MNIQEILSSDKSVLQQFIDTYAEVFDDRGNIKLCGREKCIELIILSNYLAKDSSMDYADFGNEKTGFMNVGNIKKLRNLY
jgi:hypothetical protein